MENSLASHSKFPELFYIKLGCLAFWSAWFLLAFLSNLFDFVKCIQEYALPSWWKFYSGNCQALWKVFSLYNIPPTVFYTTFILNMLAQVCSALLFFWATLRFCITRTLNRLMHVAFGLSMALWAIFIILEELFIAYPFEATHMRLFLFEMLTLMMLHLLPTNNNRYLKNET